MTYEQALKPYRGDYKRLAMALGLPPTTVHSWRARGIPVARQYQIEVITSGRAKVSTRRNGKQAAA